jgi:hypothetical protein
MGWLNASDMLHVNGLFVVGSVFRQFPDIKWITGRPTIFSPDGMAVEVRQLPRWSRYPFLASGVQYIQQESTFWRRSLWELAGSSMDASFRAEGDFDLWVRFFRHARLHSIDALIAGYRLHEGALSLGNIDRYNQVCESIMERELDTIRWGKSLKRFKQVSRSVRAVPILRTLWYRIAVKGLHAILSRDPPQMIKYKDGEWVMRE